MKRRNARGAWAAPDKDLIDEAHRAERREYWAQVKAVAQEACDNVKNGADESDTIHELVDGHEYIIYYAKNLFVLRFTENDDAYQDAGADLSGDNPIQVIAYYAMMQDVHDEFQRLDCDPGEDDD